MYIDIAQAALTLYDLPPIVQVVFLGQSQNTTFRVDTADATQFLLRIHVGIDATTDGRAVWHQPALIHSELLWLDALQRDTQLTVAHPVQNRAGAWVTDVSRDHTQPPVHCTLLRWIEGHHLDALPNPAQARRIGALMAHLHQHASTWHPPADFTRPAHDAAQLHAALRSLHALVPHGVLSQADYQMFHAATDQVQQVMRDLPRTSDMWGVIHADLHNANYLFHGDDVRPIDFARCGWGFYVYDIGLSLGYLESHVRADFLAGYQTLRPLPVPYQRLVEAFFVSSTVENFAFLSANPHEHAGLSQAIPQVVQYQVRPYVHGEAFLFGT